MMCTDKLYNKYYSTVLMNYWYITHTHCLLKRSLMRSHPVSGNSGLPMCCGKVCAEVLSDACTQGRVNPRRALRGPRCEPPGPFASVPPHKSWRLAVHINKLLNQRMRETRPEGMRACLCTFIEKDLAEACRSLFWLAWSSFIGIYDRKCVRSTWCRKEAISFTVCHLQKMEKL